MELPNLLVEKRYSIIAFKIRVLEVSSIEIFPKRL